MSDFDKFDTLIRVADEKFEYEETSDEVLSTWNAEEDMRREQSEHEIDMKYYYRNRLSEETGMDILDEDGILDWFDDIIYKLYNTIYQHYHLDLYFEVSDFSAPSEDSLCFYISSSVIEDEKAKVQVITNTVINDDLGETSICTIVCKGGDESKLFQAEIRFHNGNGFENEEGMMEINDSTEYDDSEIESFKKSIIDTIDAMNPNSGSLDGL